MPEAPDYYELLGITPDASDDDIRAAHRRAASYWHPDRNKAPNASEMMRHVNNARDTLLNTTRKRDYNLESRVYREWTIQRAGAARRSANTERTAREERQRRTAQNQESRKREEQARRTRSGSESRASVRNRGGPFRLKRFFVRLQPSGVLIPLMVTGITVAAGFAYVNLFGDGQNPGVDAARPPAGSPATSVPSTPLDVAPAPTATPSIAPTAAPTKAPAPLPTATPPLVTAATPTVLPTATPTATPTPAPSLLVGPLSGELTPHDESSPLGGFGSAFDTGISAKNFKLEVRFENPFSAFTHEWSYGVVFRQSGGSQHVLAIEGDGTWRHLTGTELTGSGRFQEPPYIEAVTALSLLVLDEQGFLFVNGAFSGILDLSSGPRDGDIALVQGVFPKDDLNGSVTQFRNLKITEMTMLEADSSGSITVDNEPISVSEQSMNARNVVLTAEFLSPYPSFSGNWSFGFQLRRTPEGTAHYVLITDSKNWLHYRRDAPDTGPKLVFKADAESLAVGGGSYSRLTVVLDGALGYVFINDVLATTIGLASHETSGANGAVAAFFAGDQPPGSRAEYRKFAIWEFDE